MRVGLLLTKTVCRQNILFPEKLNIEILPKVLFGDYLNLSIILELPGLADSLCNSFQSNPLDGVLIMNVKVFLHQ
jgi:hypothetical protein